jgi:hypothetical protein
LFIITLPIASIAWTFTREELFREIRDYCEAERKTYRPIGHLAAFDSICGKSASKLPLTRQP